MPPFIMERKMSMKKLILAWLWVLFLATFFFNTLAEVIRQRLRVKYSNL